MERLKDETLDEFWERAKKNAREEDKPFTNESWVWVDDIKFGETNE